MEAPVVAFHLISSSPLVITVSIWLIIPTRGACRCCEHEGSVMEGLWLFSCEKGRLRNAVISSGRSICVAESSLCPAWLCHCQMHSAVPFFPEARSPSVPAFLSHQCLTDTFISNSVSVLAAEGSISRTFWKPLALNPLTQNLSLLTITY